MNAAEFNTETQKLVNRGLKEGCLAGKMSPAEMIGLLEIMKIQTLDAITTIAAQNAQAKNPPIILPNHGIKLPPERG